MRLTYQNYRENLFFFRKKVIFLFCLVNQKIELRFEYLIEKKFELANYHIISFLNYFNNITIFFFFTFFLFFCKIF